MKSKHSPNIDIKDNQESIEIADIIRDGIEEYTAQYGKLPQQSWKVINHLLQCRTEELGGHIFKCDNCAHKIVTYNSCGDRHCPKCNSVARATWVEKRTEEILPVGYFHVVFTVPEGMNQFAIRNKKVFYNLLYRSVSETLLELGRDPRWLGGQIGFMAILHSWGQNILEHPHIHCIIPGGGIRSDGKKWKSFRDNYIFPTKVMASLFRGKFLVYFSEALKRSEIYLEGNLQCYKDNIKLQNFLAEHWLKNWVVYAKPPFGSAEQVVKYLGRYTHRIAISNSRILSHKDGKVAFRWKDYADNNRGKMMKLDTVEFLRRFFLHILPDGFVRIRYYGLFSNSTKTANLQKCFDLLQKKNEKKKSENHTIVERMKEIFGIDITLCSKCHKGHYHSYLEIQRPQHKKYRLAV